MFFAVALCAVSAMALPVSDGQVRDVLSRLDKELLAGDKYIKARQSRIDSLGVLMRATTDGVSQLAVSKALAEHRKTSSGLIARADFQTDCFAAFSRVFPTMS